MNELLDLYFKFNDMGMTGKELDAMLKALPWKEEKTEDGKIIYRCTLHEKK